MGCHTRYHSKRLDRSNMHIENRMYRYDFFFDSDTIFSSSTSYRAQLSSDIRSSLWPTCVCVKGALCFCWGCCSQAAESFFLAISAAGQVRGPSVQYDACLNYGRAPWLVLRASKFDVHSLPCEIHRLGPCVHVYAHACTCMCICAYASACAPGTWYALVECVLSQHPCSAAAQQ